MLYKVYYQESIYQVPIRENTRVLYIEAHSVAQVRKQLEGKGYNIETIQEISGAYKEYENKNMNSTEKI